MEHLPKVVYGCPEKTIFPVPVEQREKISANCNICRNFKNIHDWKHRMSKVHQNKLTERFRVIKSKMKINLDSVTVHDAEWGKEEEYYCYFCDKPVKKHAFDDGFTVEFMGLMKHQSELHHRASVKSYLKYHRRDENFDVFCKSKGELEKFMAKIPEAKKKYLSKLEILNKE
ncbi:hypothetical protein JTE90_019927 [Oedothorax gibbosus]|uniref:Uncharacterized protein n=1 Tax=Oedothorax gibbosus TaxID=931172 RepID=A0AAV6USN7_9ARAC|nr:hypothetical protein JTE90_019927 [Oedothorax gibbosus]